MAEKSGHEHHEHDIYDKAGVGSEAEHVTADVDVIEVTKERPYGETNFIGTYIAVCFGALACYGGFVMPATSLLLINADIGPSANIYWVVLSWTLSLSVGYTLVGRLSDIFGRRWFFIGATVIALVGCIIGATAKGVNQLIAGNALIGFATAAQLSFNYIITELVPIKDRFYVISLVFLFAIPYSAFGPVISRLLIVHTAAGWRWDFYLNIINNGISLILYVIFYHPPNFNELHVSGRTKWQEVKDMDFGGILLFTAGFLLFLMGLSWGGTLYPWGSAHVIATLVAGAVIIVAFVLYETFMPLRRPLVPMHLFRDPEYTVLTIVSAVGGMLYYALNVLYPTMVATLFTDDIVKAGLLSCAIGGGVGAGQFTASLWATPGGLFRWKLFGSVIMCTVFTGAMAGAKNQATASALIVIGSYFIGALESLAGVAVTIVIKDQTELGVAAGVYGSIRSLAGVIATAVLTTILTNRVTSNITNHLVPDLVAAGLSPTSIEELLADLNAGDLTDAATVPGVTTKILGIAGAGIQAAYSNAFTLIFLVTIAFGGVSCIAAFFSPEIEKHYTGSVVRRLHRAGKPTPHAHKKAEVSHNELV